MVFNMVFRRRKCRKKNVIAAYIIRSHYSYTIHIIRSVISSKSAHSIYHRQKDLGREGQNYEKEFA